MTLFALLKQGFLIHVGLLAVNAGATIHADNCYRALFPCSSSAALATASAFCATITAGGVTATNYPTRATAACGTTAARYLSACSAGPTCGLSTSTTTGLTNSTTTTSTTSDTTTSTTSDTTISTAISTTSTISTVSTTVASTTSTTPACPTAAPGNIIPNSDFECGLSPWTVEIPDSSASANITAPGNTGASAFEVSLHARPSTPVRGVSARIFSQPIAISPVAGYTLTFSTFFDKLDNGFIGVMVNNNPIYTVDATDKGAGAFKQNSITFFPSSVNIVLKFEFLFVSTIASGVDRIDSISLVQI
ncbi:hypothetical protein B0T17DRAFT_595609 [Bombardia bombarda]|uniref:CBM-cenC domain-containing protein n=1 Tax=Bombardia bombarda TaxID=252184 RepID=A0AA39XLZ2_9PEZI|nr:hypothetical protein B0T17DRAFT_595609 [Bombardia bombarda]